MTRSIDPIELEIFKSMFHSIAEEMGAALRRTAFSPNIKERRDYSCAVFDANGQALAMGDHMPVHLGSIPMSVQTALQDVVLEPGDVAMLNDPFRGGTHLPDITFVAPVFVGKKKRADFFVASRAHHADVGGTYPGSMGVCNEIYQEGFRIPPVKLVRRGKMERDLLSLLLANVRTPREREGDLSAQIAACHTGESRLREVCQRYGLTRVTRAAEALLEYSEKMMQARLAGLPIGSWQAEDFLDDNGAVDGGASTPVKVSVRIEIGRRGKRSQVTIDFSDSDLQVAGSTNAVEAITYSACFYVFRCLLAEDVPATSGLMRPVRLIAPEGTVVNARPPAAVAGGNVETSQRIVDVLLRALAQVIPDRIPAASQGTMNNLTIGGIDPRTGEPFAYYETVAGGAGASPGGDGASGIHTHMTNSLNTPVEALEYAYPLRVRQYGLRRGSGGNGEHRGGDGILRELEVLTDAQVTLLSERRNIAPYGLAGGKGGAKGQAFISGADKNKITGKASVRVKRGGRIRIETPGGGGWGSARD